jgi:hypothetical protein
VVFEGCGDVEELVVEGVEVGAEASAELFLRGGGGAFGAGVEEVEDGLGLREVEASVEEGAQGKFTGTRKPRPGVEECVEDFRGGLGTAVALKFDGVFAGVGTRRVEDEDQRAVEEFARFGMMERREEKGVGVAVNNPHGGRTSS